MSCKDTGVTVTALIPGPTETRLFERADMHRRQCGESAKDDPADVAREGFEAMMAGGSASSPRRSRRGRWATAAASSPIA